MRLYTLLAGPILRRIEPAKICIWLATSIQPEGLDVAVFPLTRKAGAKEWTYDAVLPTSTTYNVHQLGGRLFVILLEVKPLDPAAPFVPLTPYGYQLLFRFAKQDKVILNDKHFLSKDGGPKEFNFTETYNKDGHYTYEGLPFPVFVIPAQDGFNSRILYGSCRKTHGPGSDALNAADKLLERDWGNYHGKAGRLPDFSLFHLGDQIYADDLEEVVFDAVRELADLLMGYDEEIPEYAGLAEISHKDLTNFFHRYLANDPDYRIEDLNLPVQVDYVEPYWPGYKRINIFKFLTHYLQTDIHFTVLNRKAFEKILMDQMNKHLDSKTPDIIAALKMHKLPLIDVNEVLPREFVRKRLKATPTRVSGINYQKRLKFIRANAHISTVDDGHLLSFGEFAALYLINWSSISFIEDYSAAWKKFQHLDYKFGSTYYDDYKHNLEGVIERNRRVVRLFANCPSYMIFDDHEITDEWNLDEIWRDTVERRSAMGRRMVANGLAAFWAFQAWGNDPAAFPASLIKDIKAFLVEPLLSKGSRDPTKSKSFEDSILSFQDWAFITPTSPRAVFLDSRTLRHTMEPMDYYPDLNENKKFKAARLMSPLAFQKVAQLLKAANYKPGTPIIFCAAAPMFGSKLFELGQLHMIDGSFNTDALVARFKPRPPGRYDNDFESWSANPRGKYEFLKFLDAVVRPSKVAVLSGDVHYGCHAKLRLENVATGRQLEIEQLTSSALKNNTLEYLDKIDLLAYLSFYDSKDEAYKVTDESYPYPGVFLPTGDPVINFRLRGHLVPYSRLIDKDSWLIFGNNIGLLISQASKGSVAFTNYFLQSPYYLAPLTVAMQLKVP